MPAGAPRGNTNRRGDDPEMTSFLYLKATPGEKGAWVRASRKVKGRSLAEWCRGALNHAAGHDPSAADDRRRPGQDLRQ